MPSVSEQTTPAPKSSPFPLPLVFGVAAFVVYCLTLNHWVSLTNISPIAQVSGWTWQPELRQPLTCTVLFPFRFLPSAWLPFALNLFTAVCAALVLSLLARSVSLLVGRGWQAQLGLARPAGCIA